MRNEVTPKQRVANNLARSAITEASMFCLRLIGGLVLLALVWIGFSRFMVPALIESAYRGESFSVFNSIISGQAIHPVEYYVASWERFTKPVLGIIFVLGLIPLPLVATGPCVQIYFQARYGNIFALKPEVMNTILALFGLTLVYYLYYFHPVGYVHFITEDYWAEYGSFASWGMAFCFLTWILFQDRDLRKPGLILFAFGTFFVAMEEISWGQRITGLASPAVFAQYNYQGETNVHNIVSIPGKYTVAGIVISLWTFAVPILIQRWDRLRQRCHSLGVPIVPAYLWPLFMLPIFFLTYQPFSRSDELAELFLGVAIAALSLDIVLRAKRGPLAGSPFTSIATINMFLPLGILIVLLLGFYPYPSELRHNLNWFAAKRYPDEGMYRQALVLFEYINQYPHFVQPETRFRHGALLMQRGDPARAKEVLEIALSDQERFRREWPKSSEPDRVAGQVLTLLGRKEEAKDAFLQAIRKDQTLLQQVKDTTKEAWLRWSLGKTLLAMGNSDAASAEMSIARSLAGDRQTQYWMDVWMREGLQ